MKNLNKYINQGITYEAYFQNETDLINSDTQFEYRKYHEINYSRLKRNSKVAEKAIELTTAQKNSFHNKQLLVISEGWCGDAAQIIPYANELAKQANIPLSIVYRDKDTSLIDAFLTNGGRSIPVIILTESNGDYINHFAPRPAEAQKLMLEMKAKGIDKEEISLALQKWYNTDKGKQISADIINLAT